MANEESDDAVERLLPSQRVESLGGEEVGLRVAGEGATDEAGGQDESGTAVSISPSSYSARASAPKRSWFGGRRANKGAAAAGGTANGRPGPSGEDAPTPSVAGGASRGDARDRLLDSDDVRVLLTILRIYTSILRKCLLCVCTRISVQQFVRKIKQNI